ncbi:MAG: DEDD exonuclease domain-containing protein, partial [Tomitella sp.]|nr:DEDD exonuclease domain-containing protein [Tomitella sp.]
LTGITPTMVVDAPRMDSVLPAFLEFARGGVLVAHNARFDVGFLKAAAAATETQWPAFPELCTVRLARRVLGRDEAPSVKLSALADLFAVSTRPTHRALDDARATVDVLHGLIGRVGNQGVHSLPDLLAHLTAVTDAQKRKRSLADDLPRLPGVYMFRGPGDEVLYVGTAVNLHRRVRTYFTGSETRTRMKEMVALATRIDHVTCAHGLEAEVRELRLIGAHAPPYNRKSTQPTRAWWIDLTDEPFPRTVVRRRCGHDSLGPFRSRADGIDVAAALAEACGLRTCTHRIRAGAVHGADCSTSGAGGGCPAVHADGSTETRTEYAARTDTMRDLVHGLDGSPLTLSLQRIDELSEAHLFESAARRRDRLATLVAALERAQRLRALADVDQFITARPDGDGGWDLAVIRCGRLAAAGVAPRGVPPMRVVDLLTASAETILPGDGPLRGAVADEITIVSRWLTRPGTRIVQASRGYALPHPGAGRWREWAERARAGRAVASYLDEAGA